MGNVQFDQCGRMMTCIADLLFREQHVRSRSKTCGKYAKVFVGFYLPYTRAGEAKSGYRMFYLAVPGVLDPLSWFLR